MVLLWVLHAIFLLVLRTFRLAAGLCLVSRTGGLRVLVGSWTLVSAGRTWRVMPCVHVNDPFLYRWNTLWMQEMVAI